MTTREAVLYPVRVLGAGTLGRNLGLGALVALLLFLTAYPHGHAGLRQPAHDAAGRAAGTFSLDGYRAMLSRANALVLLNTIGLSLVKTGLAMVLALFLAWIVARTDTPYRETLEVLITLPFYIPPILTAMAWGMLATPKGGLINLAWTWLTGRARAARQHLLLRRRRVAHDAVLDAVPLPADGRRLQVDGSRARGVEPHVRAPRRGRRSAG